MMMMIMMMMMMVNPLLFAFTSTNSAEEARNKKSRLTTDHSHRLANNPILAAVQRGMKSSLNESVAMT